MLVKDMATFFHRREPERLSLRGESLRKLFLLLFSAVKFQNSPLPSTGIKKGFYS